MRIVMTISILAVAAVSLSACNTIEGVGRDLTSLGQTMKGE
jgi:predicted small secreted protein